MTMIKIKKILLASNDLNFLVSAIDQPCLLHGRLVQKPQFIGIFRDEPFLLDTSFF